MRGAAAWGAALAAALPPAGDQAPPAPPPRITAAPDRRVELDFQHYYTQRELHEALGSLAAAYPEFLRLESLGKSRGEREIWVMTVSALEGADPPRRPALLAVGALGVDDLHGTEVALYTILDLVQNHARDPAVAQLLERAAVYVVPCANPDLRARLLEEPAEGTPAPEVALDRNFPVGWDPFALGPAAGPYPLSEPESRALATFLLARENVAACQVYSSQPAPPVRQDSDLPAADLELHRRVAAGRPAAREARILAPYPDLPAPAGSLLEFAYRQRGAFAFRTDVGVPGEPLAEAGEPALPAVSELFQLGRRGAQATLALAQALPSLALGPPSVQRLKNDQWQVDLEVRNTGVLPTLSALGTERFACPPPHLDIEGARVVAAALRTSEGDPYRDAGRPAPRLRLRQVPGRSSVGVRLIVQGPPESTLTLSLDSPRAGSASASLVLK